MGVFSVPGLSDAVGPNPLLTPFPAVDTFSIASFNMPGKWTLVDATKQFDWQIAKGYGLDYAILNPVGIKLVVAKFKGEFWAAADFAIYKEIRKRILSTPAFSVIPGVSAAMGIDHPELAAMGVTAVVMLESKPAKDEGGGLWVVSHDFLQYKRPVPAQPRAATIIPDIAAPVPTARTALQIQAEKLAAQIDPLKAKLGL